MKKGTVRKLGVAALCAAAAVMSLTGCDPEAEEEFTSTVVFDPAATDTYKVYSTYEDSVFSGELVAGTDYTVADGVITVTPNGWEGAYIVLNDEVTLTGATKATAELKSSASSTYKMGLNGFSTASSKNGALCCVTVASSDMEEVESGYGEEFTGSDWSTGSEVKYVGTETLKYFQPYIQDTSDWNPTTDQTISIGKVIVYTPVDASADDGEEEELPEFVLPDGATALPDFANWGWGWNSTYKLATQTATLEKDGAISNGFDPAADWSDYSSFNVVVYSSDCSYLKLCVASTGWTTSDEISYTDTIDNTVTTLTLTFDKLDKTAVSQYMLQGGAGDVVLLGAYLK